jgi:hypothetical protein
MSTPPGWYRDEFGDVRWWDGERWQEASRARAVAAADDATASGRTSPGIGFPFRSPVANDWLFQWAMLVTMLTLVAAIGLALVGGAALSLITFAAAASWVPLSLLVLVLPIAVVRSLADAVRSGRPHAAIVEFNDRVKLGEW